MRDWSLHLMDLAQNSVRAGARRIALDVTLDSRGMLTMQIWDDGAGMDAETLARAESPFETGRESRRFGLGLPLMGENCRLAGGEMRLSSRPGQGTTLTATADTHRPDCLPLGDLAATFCALAAVHPQGPDFSLHCQSPQGEAQWDTREMKRAYGDPNALWAPEVTAWMRASIQEDIQPIFGGVIL